MASRNTSHKYQSIPTHPLRTIATASFRTLSPNTRAYKFTSTCRSLKIAKIVRGSVEEIRAPKYKVSKKVKLPLRFGIWWIKPYIRALQRKIRHLSNMVATVIRPSVWIIVQENFIKG
jgi:hypothetical protein